ncbi:hypothetical protein ACGTN6_00985 [Halomonas sp. THAF12]|uniref:hypothetical protein n=1 Tax=Halomonas sp. B23F22_10 TaxID=3459515 RepID=UPI00373FB58C
MRILDHNPDFRWGEPLPRRYFARVEDESGATMARIGGDTPEEAQERARRIAATLGPSTSTHLEQ